MKLLVWLASLLMAIAPGHVRGEIEHRRARVLPEEENAWSLWAPALARCAAPIPDELADALRRAYSFDQIPPAGEERRRLQEWLDTLQEPMAQISKGVALGQLQFPLRTVSDDQDLTSFLPLLRIARYRVALGRFRMIDGDPAGAARLFVAVYRMGRLMSEGDGFLIHLLVGNAVQNIGMHALRTLSVEKDTPIPVLEAIASGLPAPSADDPALAQAYRAEFTYYVRPSLEKIGASYTAFPDKKNGADRAVFDLPASIEVAESFMARLIANTEKPWRQRDEKIGSDATALADPADWVESDIEPILTGDLHAFLFDGDHAEAWRKLERHPARGPNLLGRVIVAGTVKNLQDSRTPAITVRVETHLTRAYLAVRIYQRKHGRLPATLSEVVDDGLLPALPPDHFTGEPLHYSPDTRILRSEGPGESVRHDHLRRLQAELPPF